MPPKAGRGGGRGGQGASKAAPPPRTPQKGWTLQGAELAYEQQQEQPSAAEPRRVALRHRGAPLPVPDPSKSLILMVLDVVEAGQGRFHVWGKTPGGATVLLRLHGFAPYLYIAAPQLERYSAAAGEGAAAAAGAEWDAQRLAHVKSFLNRSLPVAHRVEAVEAVRRKPLLFYRHGGIAAPDAPDGSPFLKLTLGPSSSVASAVGPVQRALVSPAAKAEGFVWRDLTLYESDEVKPLQRFVADAKLSGGAWLHLPPAERGAGRAAAGAAAAADGPSSGRASAEAAAGGLGWRLVPESERLSRCDVEAAAHWQAVCCLSPDASQLADPAWAPLGGGGCPQAAEAEPAVLEAAEAAARGDIAGLRMAVLDVLCATADGADRTPVASQGDPVVAITLSLHTFSARGHQTGPAAAGGGEGEPTADQQPAAGAVEGTSREADEDDEGADGDGGGGEEEEGEEEALLKVSAAAAAAAGGPAGLRPHRRAALPAATDQETLVFLLHPAAARARPQAEAEVAERSAGPAGAPARVLLFGSEAELLATAVDVLQRADPDVLGVFQVHDTLAVLQERCRALRLNGGGTLTLSRLRAPKPLQIRKITNFSASWVSRSQQRISVGSNQETYRHAGADIDGRLVVDVVRQAVAAQGLGTYTLADCVQSLLGETLEARAGVVLRPGRLAGLAGLSGPPQQPLHHARQPAGAAAAADAQRLARYALRRCEAVSGLLRRLATVPELVELARACGLTLLQAAYNGAMLRVHSLLLRTARRQGFLVPHQSKEEKGRLQETTFIMKPDQDGTVGLYRQPVAVLDFASLYPSLYRAHNLCYSTLLHRSDVARLPPEQVVLAPTGEAFVKPGVRPGVLPSMLAALVQARAATRAQLKGATDPATRAVLDCRQRALKITGTEVSPLQSVIVGDACLALGRTSCERARDVLHAAAAEGRLGPQGVGARVIYAHTDSLFVLLPNAGDARQGMAAGKLAGQVVSAAFEAPMELKFERLCQPFLLLFTNRYAGRAFEREEEADQGGGQLICKGLRSMWRQSAPILRTTLTGALQHILMRGDLRAAGRYVACEVRRLLSGQAELSELVMNGGLWRVPGEQVARSAAEGGAGGGDVRGPHAALAVRLAQRDPGRTFVLGERVPYVLLQGHKKQDDAAEDPLLAAQEGRPPNVRLYWENKMAKPLREVFEACLPDGPDKSALLEEIFAGEHTRIAVDTASAPPPALGPSSPRPAGPRGAKGGGGQQPGLGAFFRTVPKCLACKTGMSEWKGPPEDAPGLCQSCASTQGRHTGTYLALLEEQSLAEARQAAAFAACRGCHSGGCAGPVLCENAECPVTFARLACSSRLQQVHRQLRRMDVDF